MIVKAREAAFVIDDEIRLVDANDKPDFEIRHLGFGHRAHLQLNHYASDLLFLGGRELCGTPFLERKRRLRRLCLPIIPGSKRRARSFAVPYYVGVDGAGSR